MRTDIGNLYLLYSGTSPDGCGNGVYAGRTLSQKEARDHFMKGSLNPYSTGGVEIVTDDKMHRVMRIEELNNGRD